MPPPKPPGPPHHRAVPSSEISRFIDEERVQTLLQPWLPDAQDRAFVTRCILKEGPAHHRGANDVLLRLLGAVLDRLPVAAPLTVDREQFAVPMRLPPHLQQTQPGPDYPLGLPMAPLQQLAGGDAHKVDAMADCLTDGPPQHALANAAMVTLLFEILARLEAGR